LEPTQPPPPANLAAPEDGRTPLSSCIPPAPQYVATQLPDGKILVVELVEKEAPEVNAGFNADGTFHCPPLMTRAQARAAIRADRDAQ